MKARICNNCGAQIKEEKIDTCPICHRKEFSEVELPEPTEEEKKHSKKYEEALKIMEKREEGTPPRTLADATCGCGKEGGHEHK